MVLRDRAKWKHGVELYLVLSAFFLSPVSVWKFPLIWQQNGGVALLIPYAIFLVTLGLPLVYLEVSLGQFMQKAGPGVWGVVPILKGLSATSMLMCVMRVSTHIILTSWCGNFLYRILSNQLPDCLTDSAKPRLSYNGEHENVTSGHQADETFGAVGHSYNSLGRSLTSGTVLDKSLDWKETDQNVTCTEKIASLWSAGILQMSGSIITPGSTVVPIFIAALIICILCFALVSAGRSWLAKIMYVWAPLPLVACLSFILWTALSGWDTGRGVGLLLMPNFECLTHPETWSKTAHSVVLTLGVGLNVLPTLASYNQLPTSTIRVTWIVISLAVSINVLASLTVFGMARGEIDKLSQEDYPSLLFVVLPAAMSTFRYPITLSALFFIVLIVVFVGTAAVYIECVVSSIVDLSHRLRRWRVLILTGTMAACFLLTIPMTMQGGMYVFQLLERATDGGLMLSIVTTLQCLGLAWVYGGHRFYDNLEMMTGEAPHWWFKFCWAWLSPLLLLIALVYQEYHQPVYSLALGQDHPFHQLAKMLLCLMMATMVLPIPMVATWVVCNGHGSCGKKLRSAFRPQLQPFQVPIRWRLKRHWRKFARI